MGNGFYTTYTDRNTKWYSIEQLYKGLQDGSVKQVISADGVSTFYDASGSEWKARISEGSDVGGGATGGTSVRVVDYGTGAGGAGLGGTGQNLGTVIPYNSVTELYDAYAAGQISLNEYTYWLQRFNEATPYTSPLTKIYNSLTPEPVDWNRVTAQQIDPEEYIYWLKKFNGYGTGNPYTVPDKYLSNQSKSGQALVGAMEE